MIRIILLIHVFITGLSLFGQTKQVCFTIDDLPVVNYGITDTSFQKNLMDKLIASLKKNSIPAIGFVNAIKLYHNGNIDPFQVRLLESWVNKGLDLGNHTYSHPDYNSVSFTDYTTDILKGETIIREVLNANGRSLRYFRHPFLHTGETRTKAESLSHFLFLHGYQVAPITIDNDDYLFAVAYKRAQVNHEKFMMKKIGHDYLDYMERKLKYYENEANKLFGRNISQILLLHASSLNSEYVDSLAMMFRNNNYDFVSLDEALKDSAYKTDITVYGKLGISWIDKWALSAGRKGDFFRDEPVTPDYIRKLSE